MPGIRIEGLDGSYSISHIKSWVKGEVVRALGIPSENVNVYCPAEIEADAGQFITVNCSFAMYPSPDAKEPRTFEQLQPLAETLASGLMEMCGGRRVAVWAHIRDNRTQSPLVVRR